MDFKTPVDGAVVDVVILESVSVPVTIPVSCLNWPVSKSAIRIPLDVSLPTAVIVAVLRILHGMDIH